jgi:hypothetical protein
MVRRWEAIVNVPPNQRDDWIDKPMAPGSGGTNIDPPPARVRHVESHAAIESLRGRWLLDPVHSPASPIRTRKTAVLRWMGRLSLIFVGSVIGGIGVLTLATHLNEAPRHVGSVSGTVIHPPEGSSRAATAADAARLIVASQSGFANEPLPLGVSLKDASGGETLALSGLAAGTKLSAGAPLGAAGWLMSSRDLVKALAIPPKDFVGVMDAAVNLRSASDQLLDSQVIRFEWNRRKEERPIPQLDASKPSPAAVQPLDPNVIVTLITRGEEFLENGDIASARLLLKRAAVAGSAQAALKLGMTFDPVFLAQRGILGFSPDVPQAREWYNKAMKLGSAEASRHLERLASTGR